MRNQRVRRGEVYYIEARGEGSEQKGIRPALVVGNDAGNKHSTVHEIVYITSKKKKSLPTHVKVTLDRESIIQCEQIHSVSIDRFYEKICTLDSEKLERVNRALAISIGLK